MLYKKNTVNASFSELYHTNGATAGYDLFNRLTDFRRGVLSGNNDTITTSSNTVNWTMDSQGNWTNRNGVTRTHNAENQITSGGMTYDANGNTTTDDRGYALKYDAWNRLVEVKDTGGVVVRTFTYDGLNRRITQNGQQFYCSKDWQVLEDVNSTGVKRQYVWSLAYVDGLVLRDSDTDGNSGTGNYGVQGSGLETRFYALQDANWNVTSVADVTMGIAERYTYDPYGSASYYAWDWTSKANSTCAWVYLHQGGRFDSVSNAYHFRNRDYSPTLGRWISEDPAGYVDGASLYQYEQGGPVTGLDPEGLLDARSEAAIKGLYSGLQPIARKHLEQLNRKLKDDGKEARIIQGLRTVDEQNQVPPANTRVSGLNSYHVWGLAYDIGIFKCDGTYIDDARDPAYAQAGAIGKGLGLRWGGDWKSFTDKPHFQYPVRRLGLVSLKQLIGKYLRALKDHPAITPPEFVETLRILTTRPKGR